jgi:iron complex outermembrane receptor protein
MNPRDVSPLWRSVNHTKVNSIGVETSALLNLEQLLHWQRSWCSVAYSYIDQQKDEGQFLTQSKLEYLRHKLVVQLQMSLISRLDLGVKYRLQKRTGTYTTTNGEITPYRTYDVVDTRLAWNDESYKLYVEVNNLFGRHYIDYGNVPQPGVWITVGGHVQLAL